MQTLGASPGIAEAFPSAIPADEVNIRDLLGDSQQQCFACSIEVCEHMARDKNMAATELYSPSTPE
jgi:hypothetical protein